MNIAIVREQRQVEEVRDRTTAQIPRGCAGKFDCDK
jgi:hypothetical protein